MPATDEIIVYDTEFWTDHGVQQRHWGGVRDYPPLLVQIGAFRMRLVNDWPIVSEYSEYVSPIDEYEEQAPITPYFTELTGISGLTIEKYGRRLEDAIDSFAAFVGENLMYSYGNDVIGCILPSCYTRSIRCPFEPRQARDLRHILMRAGISEQDIAANTSGTLARYLGISLGKHKVHNALDDARSLVESLQRLRATGRIQAKWLLAPERHARGS